MNSNELVARDLKLTDGEEVGEDDGKDVGFSKGRRVGNMVSPDCGDVEIGELVNGRSEGW
jgi:hypothetical protein